LWQRSLDASRAEISPHLYMLQAVRLPPVGADDLDVRLFAP
jgi:hypothetical protein